MVEANQSGASLGVSTSYILREVDDSPWGLFEPIVECVWGLNRLLGGDGKLVFFEGLFTRVSSGDVESARCRFHDQREDGGPESMFRVVIGVSADRARVSVVIG